MPLTQPIGPAGPQLDYATRIEPLPPAAAAVLQSLFINYDHLTVTQELGGGFTQSRVFVVQPSRTGGGVVLPQVVKIGPVWLIEQEQAAYRTHIRDKLSGRIELVDTILADDWGALSYRLAGDGQFKHESLAQFFNQADRQMLVNVVTGRLFKRLETLWRDARPVAAPDLGGKYDLLLPVHLIIHPQPLPPDTTTYRLTPAIFGDDYLETGAAVQLEGFEIIEVNPVAGEVTLDLPVLAGPPRRSHRLRLHPVADVTPFKVGEIVSPLTGVVTRTRRERLQFEINHAFGAIAQLDLTGQTVVLPGGRKLFNPLVQLPALLHDWPAVKIGTLHGDLNLQNILVDPISGDVTLIDFSGAGEDHILRDLLHLETNVIVGLLPGTALELGAPPEHICPLFFERLYRAVTGAVELFHPPRLWHPKLQKLYLFLAAIRQEARGYLAVPDDWAEYYRGLALHLLGALKYKNLNNVPEAPLPVQLAFLGAATAVSLWQAAAGQSLPAPARLGLLSATLARSLQSVPEFGANATALFLSSGTEITNPMAELPDLLPPSLADDLPSVHGRLDLIQLAAESAALTVADIEALPDDDQLLHALLRLETGVGLGLLPQSLLEAGLPSETLRFLFYERLHRAMRGEIHQFSLPQSLPPALVKPFELLIAVRRRAVQLLPTPGDRAEYYQGLILHLLGALAQPNLAELSLSGPAKRLAFLTAALVADLWRHPTSRPQPPNPYRGLHAFQQVDAPVFFGREQFVQQLVNAVEQQPLVAVTGPSGSGKSSVVFAGLAPHLQDRASPGDRLSSWLILSCRPGGTPFKELARVLSAPLGQNAGALADALQHGRSRLPDLATQLLALQPHANRLLLIIDQFEELYTLCSDADVRRQFIDALLAGDQGPGVRGQGSETDDQQSPISQSPDLPFSILLTLRADFLSRALTYRPLADALQPGINLLGAMTAAELARAIEYPAEKMGISFEPNLVKTILDDVGDEPGRLPLLEFALTRLWQHQRAGQLTAEAYQSGGGVEGAVTHFADQIYTQLTAEQQSQARHIFTQLVQPGAGTEDTRRIASRADLEVAWPLVQHLAGARLVVTDRNAAGDEVVELVHEALIQNWARLRDWMETDRAFRAWQERLRAAIRQWQGTEQDEGGLLRGAPLAEAEEWLPRHEGDLSAIEQDFILRSISLREQQVAQIEADRQRQLRQAQERAEEQTQAANQLRRRAIWLGTALVLLLLAVIAAIGFGLSAQTNLQTAQVRATEVAANLATANHLATQESLARGEADANLATAEYRATLESAARGEAVANLATAEFRATLEAEARNNAEAAATLEAIARGEADLNLATAIYRATLEAAARSQADANLATAVYRATLEAVARSQADANLATAQYNATQEAIAQETAIAETTRSAEAEETAQAEATKAIEAEKTAVAERATAESERDRADEQTKIAVSRQLAAQSLALLPEDPTLAFLLVLEANRIAETTEARDVLLTALQTYPRLSNRLYGHAGPVESVVLSPDGQTLASAGADGAIILWQMQAGDQPPQRIGQPLTDHSGTIKSLVFSPDGQLLASASDDGTIILWQMRPDQPPLAMGQVSQDGGVNTVAFSSNGQILASGSSYGEIILWAVQPGQPLQPIGQSLRGHNGSVASLAFSPDEPMLASGSEDNTIILWDIQNPQQSQLLWQSDNNNAHKNWVWSIVFSSDGQMLASGDGDGAIILWDMSNPQRPQSLGKLPQAHQDDVFSLAFSPDGQTLASGSDDKTIILWDVQSRQKILTLIGHTSRVTSIAFSSNGQRLVSGSWDNTIGLWDVRADQPPQSLGTRLPRYPSNVNSVAFSPKSGQTLATGSFADILWWDVRNRQQPKLLGQFLDGHKGDVYSVVFSPDEKLLASGGTDSTIIIWDVQNQQTPKRLGPRLYDHPEKVLTLAFSSDGQTLASGSVDNTIILWDMQNPAAPVNLAQLSHRSDVYVLAFEPNYAQLLAAGLGDNTIVLWDVRDRQQPHPLGQPLTGHTNLISSLAFSPDGKTLASGSADNTLILWDIKPPEQPQPLVQLRPEANSRVTSVSFSPDGQTLASSYDSGEITLWDVRNQPPQPLGLPFDGHDYAVNSVDFSPDGQTLASGSSDFSTILWDVSNVSWSKQVCRKAGRNLSQAELAQYIPAQLQAATQGDAVCPEYSYPNGELTLDSGTRQASKQAPTLKYGNPVLPTATATAILSSPLPISRTPGRVPEILSIPLMCGDTRLWTVNLSSYGVSTEIEKFTLRLPSGDRPLEMRLLTIGGQPPPTVGQTSAYLVDTNKEGVTLWSITLTSDLVNQGQVVVHIAPPIQLADIFLCPLGRSPRSGQPHGPSLIIYLPLITRN
ncbi:MAG: AAA family ATPase [Anaerolineales bacterium]|nr:AAA family ATPase [Anaerolineales bacterium]